MRSESDSFGKNFPVLRTGVRGLYCLVLAICTGCNWQPPVPVTVTDLGATIQRFELVYAEKTPQDDDQAYVNRGFDQATFSFFFGDLAGTIRGIEAITTSLRGDGNDFASLIAASLKVRLTPHVGLLNQTSLVTARISSTYPVGMSEGETVNLILRIRSAGSVLVDTPFSVIVNANAAIDTQVSVAIPTETLEARNYFVELVTPSGVVFPMQRWAVVRQAISTTRDQIASKLAMVQANTSSFVDALASCRARSELILENPSEERLAEYVADPSQLEIDVADEAEQLVSGVDPYKHRTGDYWRVVIINGETIPIRVYLPSTVDQSAALPLIIAYHGYGGDENLFFEGYGVGRIKSLADANGFLVVAPSTYPFLNEVSKFDRLLDSIRDDYDVDASRIYLVGHSLGAVAAARLAELRSGTIAAACLIAGGGPFSEAVALPPTVVFAGELDPIAPASDLEKTAQRAVSRGLPVEFHTLPHLGHTIMVGEALPQGVAFLLGKRLAGS